MHKSDDISVKGFFLLMYRSWKIIFVISFFSFSIFLALFYTNNEVQTTTNFTSKINNTEILDTDFGLISQQNYDVSTIINKGLNISFLSYIEKSCEMQLNLNQVSTSIIDGFSLSYKIVSTSTTLDADALKCSFFAYKEFIVQEYSQNIYINLLETQIQRLQEIDQRLEFLETLRAKYDDLIANEELNSNLIESRKNELILESAENTFLYEIQDAKIKKIKSVVDTYRQGQVTPNYIENNKYNFNLFDQKYEVITTSINRYDLKTYLPTSILISFFIGIISAIFIHFWKNN